MNPYFDEIVDDNTWIRTFNPEETEDEDYIWHRDYNDRQVEVIEGVGWKFQFDNELPIDINSSDKIYVPKMVYHRIIPGSTRLVIKICEQPNSQ